MIKRQTLICLSLIPIALFTASSVVRAQTVQYVVNKSPTPCLKGREEPRSDANVIQCVPPGTVVTFITAVPFWMNIRLVDGRTGWGAKKFLTQSSTTPALPTTPDIP